MDVLTPSGRPLLTQPFVVAAMHVGSMAGAIARVMQTRRIDLDIDAANIGVTRHYDTIEELLGELGNARIWGGLHYRFSTDAGLHIAEQVVRQNLRHNFRLT